MTQELLTEYIEKLLLHFAEEDGEELYRPLVLAAQEELSAEQMALLLEAIPAQFRSLVWANLEEEVQRDTFLYMLDGSRKILLKQLGDEDCKQLLESLSAEDLLELAEELPDRFLNYAYGKLDTEERDRYEQASRYDVEELGHWVSFDCPQVSQRLTSTSARNVLKKDAVRYMEAIYTTDKGGRLVGEVSLQDLYEAPPATPLSAIQQLQPEALQARQDIDEAVNQLIHSERLALPVVDEDGLLIGRFDIGSAYEHRQEITDYQVAQAGGLADEEELFAPVWRSSKNRAVWLGVNLVTALLASWFIGMFEATLQEVVALAVLMPVVASMGGISGSQTLTVMVRGLAMGQVTSANLKALLHKEFKVGCVNGVVWALVIGLVAYLWFGSWLLGATICVAILLNIIAAVIAGVYVPSLLDRLNFDPALSGAVILTTVTDIVGFVVFLGLGSLWLL
ncbi:MAG: magnesium transporter [Gammaproteobacteria bacterium]|uniref:magnesium transporter n=1 Tax=Pseudomaricurvus alcaniphilus TaxID=1166482 RepID=UPI001407B079|nr:magnesium transporter [Pseudomaricurvus alcaniphilus]MBR9909614.1 magnesium transporter [Gammaproteobacteria bacterium]NHN36970.1 magnesium transporter [Pseudomaricurvus alcaniphilus]